MEGDGWQYGDPPTVEELRKHIRSKRVLLIQIPGWPSPTECSILELAPGDGFVKILINGGGFMWFDVEKIRIVAELNKKQQLPQNQF